MCKEREGESEREVRKDRSEGRYDRRGEGRHERRGEDRVDMRGEERKGKERWKRGMNEDREVEERDE